MIAVGIDLIEIDRIAGVINRHGWRFFERCFTLQEIIAADGKLEAFAVRFAAKEAASKVLGTGIGRVGWREIEVVDLPSGQPQLCLSGAAAEVARDLRLEHFSVSLTHTKDYAAAVVVAGSVGSPD
ncbi:MAG: holo-ACP synthase [Anaerolineales bacterium]|nr:holo-ACP synthase [Anaerolineales bacterium]